MQHIESNRIESSHSTAAAGFSLVCFRMRVRDGGSPANSGRPSMLTFCKIANRTSCHPTPKITGLAAGGRKRNRQGATPHRTQTHRTAHTHADTSATSETRRINGSSSGIRTRAKGQKTAPRTALCVWRSTTDQKYIRSACLWGFMGQSNTEAGSLETIIR